MREQIILSLKSVDSQIRTGKGYFEIFGYDFIIDSDHKTRFVRF